MLNFKIIGKIKSIFFPFYKDSDLKFIFKEIRKDQPKNLKTVMFVGGCVRKYLQNEKIDDIDLATNLTPEQIKEKFKNSRFNVVDTGIKHGTVTLIYKKKKFEITTLRKDVETDGRHALVSYTDNWLEDSKRRDISINAIYLDENGKIYDPQGGVEDLRKKQVKFIGDPNKRIQEDYLRILRFLRFSIQYDSSTDLETISALKHNLDGIKQISKERILDELIKILKLKNFDNILKHKNKKQIFSIIFPELRYLERTSKFKYLKDIPISFDLLLSTLLFDETNNYEYFCHKYKVTSKLNENLTSIFEIYMELKKDSEFFKKNLKKNIYFYGKEKLRKLAILKFFEKSSEKKHDLISILNNIEKELLPVFLYDGSYLKKRGMEEGVLMGRILNLIEEEWIKNDFKISEDQISSIIQKQKN